MNIIRNLRQIIPLKWQTKRVFGYVNKHCRETIEEGELRVSFVRGDEKEYIMLYVDNLEMFRVVLTSKDIVLYMKMSDTNYDGFRIRNFRPFMEMILPVYNSHRQKVLEKLIQSKSKASMKLENYMKLINK
jgi:hypothetical protein